MLAAVMPEMTRPDEQPPQVRRQRHQDVVETEPEIRQQDHRPPAETIGQHAVDRREHELHQRPGGAEQAETVGGARGVAAEEIDHQPRQHRNDDAERQHVEQHGDEDEDEGGAAHGRGAADWRGAPGAASSLSGFASGIRVLLLAQRQPDRRAGQVECLAQAVDEIAPVVVGHRVGAAAGTARSSAGGFSAASCSRAGCGGPTPRAADAPAIDIGEPAVERAGRHALVPDRVARRPPPASAGRARRRSGRTTATTGTPLTCGSQWSASSRSACRRLRAASIRSHLFMPITSARPSRSTRSAMRRSCSSNGVCASISTITTSAKRIALSASATESFSSFSSIRALAAHAGGVVDAEMPAVPVEIDRDGVAGDAGLGPGEQALLAEQPVDQRRLAGVRPADHRDADRPRRVGLLARVLLSAACGSSLGRRCGRQAAPRAAHRRDRQALRRARPRSRPARRARAHRPRARRPAPPAPRSCWRPRSRACRSGAPDRRTRGRPASARRAHRSGRRSRRRPRSRPRSAPACGRRGSRAPPLRGRRCRSP